MSKILIGGIGVVKTFANVTFDIHKLIAATYTELINFAGGLENTSINNIITDVRNGIYILLGIFMVFRMGISLINYLINPDQIADKQIGAGKMISRIVVSFLLLLGLPFIFNFTNDLQTAILGRKCEAGEIDCEPVDGALDKILNLVSGENYKNSTQKDIDTGKSILIDNVLAKEGSNCQYGDIKFSNQKVEGSTGLPTDIYKEAKNFYTGCYYNEKEIKNMAEKIYKQQLGELRDDNGELLEIKECAGNKTNGCYRIHKVYSTNNKYDNNVIIKSEAKAIVVGYDDLKEGTKERVDYVLTIKLTISKQPQQSLTCYYIYNKTTNSLVSDTSSTNSVQGNMINCAESIAKITFNKNTGYPIEKKLGLNSIEGWRMQVENNQQVSGYLSTGSKIIFNTASFDIDKVWIQGDNYIPAFVDKLDEGRCPEKIYDINCTGINCIGTYQGKNIRIDDTNNASYIRTGSFVGGYKSIQDIIDKEYESCIKSDTGFTIETDEDGNIIDDDNPTIKDDTGSDKISTQAKKEDDICEGNKKGGCDFARELLKAFVTSKKSKEDFEINSNDENDLSWPAGSNVIAQNIDDGKTDFNWFMSLILGIAVLVFLITMAIEIVIRNFKLIILEMVAPIPVVSYMNPKDQVFDNWGKQYISTYLDLFIKLLGIKLAAILIAQVVTPLISGKGFLTILCYLLGAIVFMKIAPDFISKILGIKDMGGTFKDSLKMVKTAAGVGAGASVGLLAGGISGFGKGGSVGTVISGMFKGMTKGAGSGAKGNIMGGAKSAIESNKKAKAANASGSTWWGRKTAQMQQTFGFSDNYEKAEDRHKSTVNALEDISKYEEQAEKDILKLAGLAKNQGVYRNDEFGKLVMARNRLNDIRAGSIQGDQTQAEAAYKQAQKDAYSAYTALLKGDNRENMGHYQGMLSGKNAMDVDRTKTLLRNAESSLEKAGITGGYSKNNKDNAEKMRDQAKGEMDKYKPDHDAAQIKS